MEGAAGNSEDCGRGGFLWLLDGLMHKTRPTYAWWSLILLALPDSVPDLAVLEAFYIGRISHHPAIHW